MPESKEDRLLREVVQLKREARKSEEAVQLKLEPLHRKIVEAYQAGVGIADLLHACGYTKTWLYAICRRHNVEPQRYSRPRKTPWQKRKSPPTGGGQKEMGVVRA